MSTQLSIGAVYLYTKTGATQYFPKGFPLPPGFVIAPSNTVSSGATYTETATGQSKYYAKGMIVPAGWVIVQPTTSPAPATTLLPSTTTTAAVISTGGAYITSSGDSVTVPAGQAVPSDWKPAPVTTSTPPPGSVPFAKGSDTMYVIPEVTIIPKGYYPTQPGTYLYKAYDRSGLTFDTFQQVENLPPYGDGPVYLLSYSADSSVVLTPTQSDIDTVITGVTSPGGWYLTNTGASTYLSAGSQVPSDWTWDAVKNSPAPIMDLTPAKPQTSPLFDKIAYAVGILGAAGIAYVGYLYVMRPNEIKYFLIRFNELKCLFVDSAQLMAAVAVIAGLSFVGYEFFVSYSKTGTFGGALGDMTARALEEMATIIIEVFETLGKDLWDWFKQELKDLWDYIKPSWL